MKNIRHIIYLLIISTKILKIWSTTEHNLNQIENRDTILHLMEWKYSDIGAECENWLGPKGFGGVQLSPVAEHVIMPGRPWMERYKPISYIIKTRSGDESDFLEMSKKCNDAGVRIYVEIVLNHMCPEQPFEIIGTANSTANPSEYDYPAVPYTINDFNEKCEIENWISQEELRNCQVDDQPDLDLTNEHVQDIIVKFLNRLIELGVAGFRIDTAIHIWPDAIEEIFDKVNDLNVDFGFQSDARPFLYFDMRDFGSQSGDVGRWEYVHMGPVTDVAMPGEYGRTFSGKTPIRYLITWGTDWLFLPSQYCLTFVDNYKIQRDIIFGVVDVLTYQQPKLHKMGTAFMLAFGHGLPNLMSSYELHSNESGPPQDKYENILSPDITADGKCQNGWICEHRWHQIVKMIEFRNIVHGTVRNHWWDNRHKQMGFCRGRKGFIIFNTQNITLDAYVPTCMPAGVYCDIISGDKVGNTCTGVKVIVDDYGMGYIDIAPDDENGFVAIHIESSISIQCNDITFKEYINRLWNVVCDVNMKFERNKIIR